MVVEKSIQQILWEIYLDGCRRLEAELWRFVGPLNEWVSELLKHRLPVDWRARMGAYLDSWEPEGFEVAPDERVILEEWIHAWAELRGLLPVELAEPLEPNAHRPTMPRYSSGETQPVARSAAVSQSSPSSGVRHHAASSAAHSKASTGTESAAQDPRGNERSAQGHSVFIPVPPDYPTKGRIAAAKSRDALERQLHEATYQERTRQVLEARGAMGEVLAGRWRFNQDLLDYYHRIMEQMILVGNALFDGGLKQLSEDLPVYRVQNESNTEIGSSGKLYVQRAPNTVKVYFPANWEQLREAMLYSKSQYNQFGVFNVDLSATENAHNVGGLPGIAISREAFYGTERDAISELIHEPMHDLGFGLLWLGVGHGHISRIVPTQASRGQDAFTQFFDFLNYSTGIGGKSLWSLMLGQAGHRPARPWRDRE